MNLALVAFLLLVGISAGLLIAALLVVRRAPSAHQPVQRVFTAPRPDDWA